MSQSPLYHWSLLVLLMALPLSGCGTPPTAAPTPVATALPAATNLAPQLSVAEVQRLYAAGEVVIIDVREESEFQQGHIPGARLMPLDEIADHLSEIPRDETVVVVCRSGARSARAYQYLQEQGFTNVHNMQGGMLEWIAAGYETEE